MLSKNNISLRNYIDTDLELLLELRNDIAIQELLMTRPRPNDKGKLLNWIRSIIDDNSKILFIIAEKEKNNAIGFIKLDNIDLFNGHCELGICIHQKLQKKGYFIISMNLIEKYIINILNLHKIIVKIRSDNEISSQAFKKIGFRNIGILEKHLRYGKRIIDVFIMEKILK